MKIVIDISKDRYDEIMSMDWKNCRLLFDEELRAIHDGKALEQEPCGNCISRQAVLEILNNAYFLKLDDGAALQESVKQLPPVTQQPNKWIPCSERLPEDLEPVNITWVNHNPKGYYADIKDKPFTATGHYCKGRWYWYSSTCQDYLEEYGRCDVDEIDTDIEITAWMPLPTPYQSETPTGSEGSEKE